MGTIYHLQLGQKAVVVSATMLEQNLDDVRSEFLAATDGLNPGDIIVVCGIINNAEIHQNLAFLRSCPQLTFIVTPCHPYQEVAAPEGGDHHAGGEPRWCQSLELIYEDQGVKRLLVDPGSAERKHKNSRMEILERLSKEGRGFSDATKLDPQTSIARYIISRSSYRKLGLFLLWVAFPVLLILTVHIPLLLSLPFRDNRSTVSITSTELIVITILLDLLLAIVVSAFTGHGLLRILDTPLDAAMRSYDPNGKERLRLDELSRNGYHGLISGDTLNKELLSVAGAIFASPGNFGVSVNRMRTRIPMPAIYTAMVDASWLELEQGATLRVRLWTLQRLKASSRLLRLLAMSELRRPIPRLLASTPDGPAYSPIVRSLHANNLRFRRVSAIIVFVGGIVELATALLPPLHQHLRLASVLFPNVGGFVRQYANALAAVAAVGMIAVALGLHAGRRRSFQISMAVASLAFIGNLGRGGDPATLIVVGVVIAVLLFNRHAFDQPTPAKPTLFRLVRIVATMFVLWAIAVAVTVTAHLLTRRHGTYNIIAAFGRVVELSFGLSSLAPSPFEHPYLRDSLQLSMFALLLLAIWAVVAPLSTRTHLEVRGSHSREALRRILRAHPQSTLDYFALRDDKLLWVRHGVIIAYGIFGSSVIISPDPIGPRSNARLAFVEFYTDMKRQGRSVAILGASAAWQSVYRSLDMRSYYIGDEAVVTLGGLDLAGKRHKSLRQAVNRMKKYGYSVDLSNPAELAITDREQILAIMTASRRGDRERGFSMTLGRIFDPRDTDLLMSICRNKHGVITGFCQWVPAPAVNGYSLDLMRRDMGEHPNGMFDLLIVETILQLGEQGYGAVSLNFAAMRAVLAGERGSGIPSKVERWVLERLSDSMQIESLWHFNAKFDPVWLPRYLVIDSIENLPAIAIAASRAESLWDLPIIGRFLAETQLPSEPTPSSR